MHRRPVSFCCHYSQSVRYLSLKSIGRSAQSARCIRNRASGLATGSCSDGTLVSTSGPSTSISQGSSRVHDNSVHATLPETWPDLLPALLLSGSGDMQNTESGGEPEPEPGSDRPGELSDQEWEIRTGRAIYVLQHTLPDFFTTGLISSLDTPTVRRPEAENHKNGHPRSFTDRSWLGFMDKGKAKAKEDVAETEGIYSPRIRLEYSPPAALPPPLPRILRVEGLHLYIASSVFVRHTLIALYTDLHVSLRRVRVHGPRSPNTPGSGRGATGTSTQKHRSMREKSLFVGLTVSGLGRVSRTRTEWEVNCTYHFSPMTGLIFLHTVDSIEPAPHQSLFEALGKFGLVAGDSDGGSRRVGRIGQ